MFNSELEVIQCGIQILMITAPVYLYLCCNRSAVRYCSRGSAPLYSYGNINQSFMYCAYYFIGNYCTVMEQCSRQLPLFIQLHGLLPPLVYLFTINVFDGEIRLSRYSVINLFLWNKNKESDCFDSRILRYKNR